MSFKVSNRHLQNEIIATWKLKYDNDMESIKVEGLNYELSGGMLTEYRKYSNFLVEGPIPTVSSWFFYISII